MTAPSDAAPLWAVFDDEFVEHDPRLPLPAGALGLLAFSRGFDDPHAMLRVLADFSCPTVLAVGTYGNLAVLDAMPDHVEVGGAQEPYAMVRWRLRRSAGRLSGPAT